MIIDHPPASDAMSQSTASTTNSSHLTSGGARTSCTSPNKRLVKLPYDTKVSTPSCITKMKTSDTMMQDMASPAGTMDMIEPLNLLAME